MESDHMVTAGFAILTNYRTFEVVCIICYSSALRQQRNTRISKPVGARLHAADPHLKSWQTDGIVAASVNLKRLDLSYQTVPKHKRASRYMTVRVRGRQLREKELHGGRKGRTQQAAGTQGYISYADGVGIVSCLVLWVL